MEREWMHSMTENVYKTLVAISERLHKVLETVRDIYDRMGRD